MERARRVALSAAVFVLVCFFLPWVQVSCGGIEDSASGFELARTGDRALWLVPLLMLAVILPGLLRAGKRAFAILPLASLISGLVSAYLMNHERLDAERASGIIGARMTGWFWLGFFSSLGLAASALLSYPRRSKSP